MFLQLQEAITNKKAAVATQLTEEEIAGACDFSDEEEFGLNEEMEELRICHERSKLDGIEFANLFLEDVSVSDADSMEDELDDEENDDDLLTNMDISDEDMAAAEEDVDNLEDMDYGDKEENELTGNDESFELDSELPDGEADEDLNDIDLTDLEDLL
jgi:hypothetical protein